MSTLCTYRDKIICNFRGTLINRGNNSATDLFEKENNQIMINMEIKLKQEENRSTPIHYIWISALTVLVRKD